MRRLRRRLYLKQPVGYHNGVIPSTLIKVLVHWPKLGEQLDAEGWHKGPLVSMAGSAHSSRRELVLRLASILWRLRRATTMETGLFEIQADHLQNYWENRQLLSDSRGVIHTLSLFRRTEPDPKMKDHKTVECARCFLRLANLRNFALDRLSRYEATLWRQASRILFALDALDRRKQQERASRHRLGNDIRSHIPRT